MAVVRMCARCGRHNGPSFTHCMNCGVLLKAPPVDPPDVQRDRARRLLDGLTAERRSLLPPTFLAAVEKQAAEPSPGETDTGGFATVSGSFASVDSTGELQLGPAIRTYLGPRRRDHPADIVTQPDFPAILTSAPVIRQPHRLESPEGSDPTLLPGQSGPDPEEQPEAEPASPPDADFRPSITPGLSPLPTDPGRMTPTADPIWAQPEMDIYDAEPRSEPGSPAPWEEPFVPPPSVENAWETEPPPHATESLDGDISWGPQAAESPEDDGIHTFYDFEPLAEPEPEPDQPLHRALKTGTGPFGPRSNRLRLVMLPDDGYRGRIHFLQHRLAQTLQIDLFKARQYLQRTTPTFLLAGDDRIELEGMKEHLTAGGVVALLVDRDRWLHETAPFLAASAHGDGPGPVCFVDADGEEMDVYRADISWAALAEIRSEGAIDALTSLDGASISLESRTRTYHLVDLFRYSSRAPVRIRSDRFDFGCLGDGKKLAAAVNLRAMVRWLSPEESNPLRPDDSFKRIPAVAGVAARGELDEESARIPPREVDFTEYTVLLDKARRHR